MTNEHAWSRPPKGTRGDIVGVRALSDGRTEYLMHNEALCNPYYLAVSSRASTQPTQTAVGEGELPALNPTISEEAEATKWFPSNRLARLEREARLCRERQLSEAIAKGNAEMERVKACEHIAEGDEGWEALVNLCPSTMAVAAFRREYVQAIAQRDEARSERDIYREMGDSLEAKLAALDVPKPEGGEIERLERGFWEWYGDNYKRLDAEYRNQKDDPPFKPEFLFANAAWKYVLSRLRSLPNEPAK